MDSTTRAQIVTVRPAFRQGGFMEPDGVTGTRYVIRESSDDYLVDVRPDGIGQAWVSKTRCEADPFPHLCEFCEGTVDPGHYGSRFCSVECEIAANR